MTKDEIKQMVNTISEYEKRLCDKYIEIDNLNRDYRNAFERLKSQQQEIDRLKSENTQLKTEVREFEVELNARLTCDFVRTAQKHAVQDFADKLKTQFEEKEQHYISMYDWNGHSAVTDCENEVDELLKEYEK